MATRSYQGLKDNGRLGDAAWAAMRDEYVTGNESYAELAKRYGTTKKTVEAHALKREANQGRTWGEMRQEFQDDVSGRIQEKTAEGLAQTLARVREKAASVAEKALTKLEQKLDTETPIEDRDLVQIAKLATTVKIEIGGDANSPVNVRASLDKLTVDELRRLAAES